MAVKNYKPTTNGRRNMSVLDFSEITTDTPEKSLLVSITKCAGRNTVICHNNEPLRIEVKASHGINS